MIVLFIDGRAPHDSIRRLRELTAQFGDPILEALELAVSGVTDLRHGDTARGFTRLDEAMLPVIAGRVPAEWGGDIYCTVIHVCRDLADFTRMAEWTSATRRGCRTSPARRSIPESVAYTASNCAERMASGPRPR